MKKAKPTPATKLTLESCRKAGWLVQVVEHWVPNRIGRGGIRRDLWGFVDVLAVQQGQAGVLGIQATSWSNRLARVRKIMVECEYQCSVMLSAGNRVEVWSWRKRPVGNRSLWRKTITQIRISEGNLEFHDDQKDIPP